MVETRGQATSISQACLDWLGQEIQNSSTSGDINAYLDDYVTAVEGLSGGWDHPKNYTARKLESHLSRLPYWFEAYSYDPLDDYQSARLLFAGLMQTSGSYRNQCYLQATSAEDYIHRRTTRSIGINFQGFCQERLEELVPDGRLSKARINLEGLGDHVSRAISVGEAAVRRVCNRVQDGQDLGKQTSASVMEMLMAQHVWSRLVIDSVIFAAKIRNGNLQTVPFLEPKSISLDPKVIYPITA
ncbi:hypothetical protein HY380_00895 [Candidatus Saccharibacteria bacterium]|nr:hypothetical protein [Candidatus Saccharibacteria bacterium]